MVVRFFQATNNKYFIAVITEYIRSLGYYHMPIEVRARERCLVIHGITSP